VGVRLLIVLLIAFSAEAGIVYRFSRGGSGGRVWIDGDKKRVELDPNPGYPREYDVSITVNGKTTYVNLQNKTYYFDDDKRSGRAATSHRNFHLPIPVHERIKGKPKITYRNEGPDAPIGGHATTRHVLQVRYRLQTSISGTSLIGDVDATLTVLAVPTLPRFGDDPPVHTGLSEVDDPVMKHFASIEGLIIAHVITVNRKLEGGPVITESSSITVEELKTIDVDAKVFEVPAGFAHQAPAYGFPGL